MSTFTESVGEVALGWFQGLGSAIVLGPTVASGSYSNAIDAILHASRTLFASPCPLSARSR